MAEEIYTLKVTQSLTEGMGVLFIYTFLQSPIIVHLWHIYPNSILS